MSRASACPYCFGHGLCAGMAEYGLRRPIPEGVKGQIHPPWKIVRRVRCDRCKKPVELPPAPTVVST